MKIILPVKALSINAAYRGRRFNTAEKTQYDRTLALILPKRQVAGKYFRIDYQFHLVNFAATDQQNLLKCLTDAIVRKGIIPDDRYIIDERIRKYKSERDYIEVNIEGLDTPEV